MNELKRKIRFSTMATALDLSPKAFRNWLQRYDLDLLSDHKVRGWTEFALADVAVLAVTRELVRWGVGVENANAIAFRVITSKAGPLIEYRNTPADALLAALTGATFCVYSPDAEDGPRWLPTAKIENDLLAAIPSFAIFNAQEIVSRSFERIPEGAESNPETSE